MALRPDLAIGLPFSGRVAFPVTDYVRGDMEVVTIARLLHATRGVKKPRQIHSICEVTVLGGFPVGKGKLALFW